MAVPSTKTMELFPLKFRFFDKFRECYCEKPELLTPHTLLTAEIIKWQKCAGMGLNGFHTR